MYHKDANRVTEQKALELLQLKTLIFKLGMQVTYLEQVRSLNETIKIKDWVFPRASVDALRATEESLAPFRNLKANPLFSSRQVVDIPTALSRLFVLIQACAS